MLEPNKEEESMEIREWVEKRNHAMWLLGWSTTITLIFLVLVILAMFQKCGIKPKSVEQSSCDGKPVGTIINEACEGGQITYICQETGLSEVARTCAGCNKVTFEDVKPLLETRCASCHFSPEPYSNFVTASQKIDEFIRRVNLSAEDPRRMPKTPNSELSIQEKGLLEGWRRDGLVESKGACGGNQETGYIDFNKLETAMITDLSQVEANDQRFTRYLVKAHKVNLGDSQERLEEFTTAINKTVNSLASNSRDITLVTSVDGVGSAYRIDLRSYDMDRNDWLVIERDEPFDIVSKTNKGRILQFLTATRKPWVHFDSFIEASVGTPANYYRFTGVPGTFKEFSELIGLDYENDLLVFDAIFSGFNGSPISKQKNRLVGRYNLDGNFGRYAYITYDPISLDGVRERNLFEFPLIKETNGDAIFDFAAGEVIVEMNNGLHLYALFNAAGVRQLAAPTNVVIDTESPIDEEIANGSDCMRCHAAGILRVQDEIRAHFFANADKFTPKDRVIIPQLYKSQGSMDAGLIVDNRLFAEAMKRLAIINSNVDPVNIARDNLLLDWSVEEVASFLFLSVEQFKSGLKQSAIGQAQVGQLLTGGSITFDQLVQVLPVLINDLRLFEEPINGQSGGE